MSTPFRSAWLRVALCAVCTVVPRGHVASDPAPRNGDEIEARLHEAARRVADAEAAAAGAAEQVVQAMARREETARDLAAALDTLDRMAAAYRVGGHAYVVETKSALQTGRVDLDPLARLELTRYIDERLPRTREFLAGMQGDWNAARRSLESARELVPQREAEVLFAVAGYDDALRDLAVARARRHELVWEAETRWAPPAVVGLRVESLRGFVFHETTYESDVDPSPREERARMARRMMVDVSEGRRRIAQEMQGVTHELGRVAAEMERLVLDYQDRVVAEAALAVALDAYDVTSSAAASGGTSLVTDAGAALLGLLQEADSLEFPTLGAAYLDARGHASGSLAIAEARAFQSPPELGSWGGSASPAPRPPDAPLPDIRGMPTGSQATPAITAEALDELQGWLGARLEGDLTAPRPRLARHEGLTGLLTSGQAGDQMKGFVGSFVDALVENSRSAALREPVRTRTSLFEPFLIGFARHTRTARSTRAGLPRTFALAAAVRERGLTRALGDTLRGGLHGVPTADFVRDALGSLRLTVVKNAVGALASSWRQGPWYDVCRLELEGFVARTQLFELRRLLQVTDDGLRALATYAREQLERPHDERRRRVVTHDREVDVVDGGSMRHRVVLRFDRPADVERAWLARGTSTTPLVPTGPYDGGLHEFHFVVPGFDLPGKADPRHGRRLEAAVHVSVRNAVTRLAADTDPTTVTHRDPSGNGWTGYEQEPGALAQVRFAEPVVWIERGLLPTRPWDDDPLPEVLPGAGLVLGFDGPEWMLGEATLAYVGAPEDDALRVATTMTTTAPPWRGSIEDRSLELRRGPGERSRTYGDILRVVRPIPPGQGRLRLITRTGTGDLHLRSRIDAFPAGSRDRALKTWWGRRDEDLPAGTPLDLVVAHAIEQHRLGVVLTEGALTVLEIRGADDVVYGTVRVDVPGRSLLEVFPANDRDHLVHRQWGRDPFDLPPGRYDLVLRDGSERWFVGIDVASGERTVVGP